MEALKTDFPSSVLPEQPLRSPPCEHFQCSGPILIFIVIGPFQNHYATYDTVGTFALESACLYSTLYNLHISFHVVSVVLHPVLVCRGRNAIICANSSCFGTIALGSLWKWFSHKLFMSGRLRESRIVSAFKCHVDSFICL